MTVATVAHRRSALIVTGVGYLFAITMAGTTLPTPLYAFYQRELHFGALMTTVIYAAYAIGVLATLLLLGRASDIVGRRPVMLVAVVLSMVSALVFLTHAGLIALFVGRVVSGLSAGLVTAAATASMIENAPAARKTTVTLVATAVNMLGLGLGPLLAGVLAEFGPTPLRTVFLVDLALLVPAALVVTVIPETVPVESAPYAQLRHPQAPDVPEQTRAVFVPSSIAAFAAFSVFGFMTAVEPGLLATVLHHRSHFLAGAVVFSMFAGSALGQTISAGWSFRRALPAGCVILIVGLAGVSAALVGRDVFLLAAATIIVGAGQGVCFRAGMSAIASNSPDDRRAETISAFMVVVYTSISLPVIAVGVTASVAGLYRAALIFAGVVALLALVAIVALGRVDAREFA